MITFALCPLQEGYNYQPKHGVKEQNLSRGFARQRASFVNVVDEISVSVLLHTKARQQYFWAFWRTLCREPQKFLWGLISDSHELQIHECQMIFDSLIVGDRSAKVYSVSFTIRTRQLNNGQYELDQLILDAWQNGIDPDFTHLLERLVNVSLPDAVENL